MDKAQVPASNAAQGQKGAAGLRRSMGLPGTLLITVSCLSPSIAVFVVGSDAIRQVGTGVFVCFAAAALFGVAMAFVYGELGSAFPSAGGEYTIFGRVLGSSWAKGVLGLNLLGFSISLALSGFGVAAYLGAVWPELPVRPVAVAAVAIATLVAVLRIEVGARVTGGFLLSELAALAALTGLGMLHAHRGAAALIHPVVADAAGATATPTWAALGAGTVAGIYAFNGYGAAIFFGEEMRDAHRDLAPAVLLALAVGIAMVLPPIAFVILAAPDLHALSAAPAPIAAFVAQLGGQRLAQAMSLGVALALFNTMIAIALMAGRQLYATGRDGLWPAPVSKALAATQGRWGSPWVATLLMGGGGLLACLLDAHVLVLILGNGNVVTYAGLCLASLKARQGRRSMPAGWRMPGFPAPPMLGLVFLSMVVVFDVVDPAGRAGLAVTASTVAAALVLLARTGGEAYRERESR